MSDIGSDYDAAVEMVSSAQERLFQKEPNHQLISFMSIEDEEKAEALWRNLFRSFSRNPEAEGEVRGAMEVTYALAQYLVALEVALGEREETKTVCPDPFPRDKSFVFRDENLPF